MSDPIAVSRTTRSVVPAGIVTSRHASGGATLPPPAVVVDRCAAASPLAPPSTPCGVARLVPLCAGGAPLHAATLTLTASTPIANRIGFLRLAGGSAKPPP